MKDSKNHIFYTIFLQYPFFFRNISQFCELKDIINLRKTNKLLYYHCISKKDKLWWKHICLKEKTNTSIIPIIKSDILQFYKIYHYNSDFFTILKNMMNNNIVLQTYGVHKFRRHISVEEGDDAKTPAKIIHLFDMLIKQKTILSHIVANINHKQKNEDLLYESLWIVNNMLAGKTRHVQWLLSEENIIQKLTDGLQLTKTNKNIESYIWCFGNLLAEDIKYFENKHMKTGISYIFKKIKEITQVHSLRIIFWFFSLLSHVKKFYIQNSILSFVVQKFDLFDLYYFSDYKCDIYIILKILFLKKNDHLFSALIRSDMISQIISDILHRNTSVQEYALETISNLITNYNLDPKLLKQLLSVLHHKLYIQMNRFTKKEERTIGLIISNIILDEYKEINNYLVKQTSFLDYFYNRSYKSLHCQIDFIFIISNLIIYNSEPLIQHISNRFNLDQYIFDILKCGSSAKTLSQKKIDLILNCLHMLCLIYEYKCITLQIKFKTKLEEITKMYSEYKHDLIKDKIMELTQY